MGVRREAGGPRSQRRARQRLAGAYPIGDGGGPPDPAGYWRKPPGAEPAAPSSRDRVYDRKREEYLAQYRARAAREREGFAPPFRVALRDNGRQYTRLILEALEREQITLADVSDYLGVRLKHLDEIAGAVERAATAG